MEKKVNIAELLKGCPKGMALYSPIFGEVYLDKIKPHLSIVVITDKEQGDFKEEFLYDGRYGMNGECMLFPSKENRDWSKFQRPFKDGDILISGLAACEYNPFIFKQTNGFGNAQCYCAINVFEELVLNSDNWTSIKGCRLATEEEKEKLFQAIKDNGLKWNAETKTLEKLPKFKVGDKIKRKGVDDIYVDEITTVEQTIYTFRSGSFQSIEYIDKNYELIPNKFDITTLKPFDKVLVRCSNNSLWEPQFFANLGTDLKFPFVCTYNSWPQCIPYEGNEHLSNTKNDCDDYFKNW